VAPGVHGVDEREGRQKFAASEKFLGFVVCCGTVALAAHVPPPPGSGYRRERHGNPNQPEIHTVTPLMRGKGLFVTQFSKNEEKSRHSGFAFIQFANGILPWGVSTWVS
jgi:hypothetical protein